MHIILYLHCCPLHQCLCVLYWHCAPLGPAVVPCYGSEMWSWVWKLCWAPAQWSTGQPSGRPGPLCHPGSMPLQNQQIGHRKQAEMGSHFKKMFRFLLCFYHTALNTKWGVWGLTIYVVHREAVGEVSHVCLLPKRRFLQWPLGPTIIQTL